MILTTENKNGKRTLTFNYLFLFFVHFWILIHAGFQFRVSSGNMDFIYFSLYFYDSIFDIQVKETKKCLETK